tara:strand:+ start:286 stop:528 length:243 start_codon:yes stop_codon:yes gene_type:complete
MTVETLTAEQIAKHYSAAEDSVTLINELVALSERDDEQVDTVRRNVEHLEIMVAKDFWTTEDLAPLNAAITAGTAVLPAE